MAGPDDASGLDLGNDETLAGDEAQAPSSSAPPRVDPGSGDLDASLPAQRYSNLQLLGRGGMGEVQLCRDERIGRNVAMKLIREGRSDTQAAHSRFLREAKVQAQLEHPAIVPVYDLGRDEQGRAYFTMKRIRGHALDKILEQTRRQQPESTSRRRLLSAFGQVCLAVDYAHERGVLHRDLKPSNVMLGDYGEVYVLDWGLAKLADSDETHLSIDQATMPEEMKETAVGEIIGTPGYIAPEMLEGIADSRSDVYALGAILFEILTLQPLHRGKTPQALLVSTLEGVEARPSVRLPDVDVAPELEAICVKATAKDRAERYATARELHDAVERYLDGDRDLALRQKHAAEHAERARTAAKRALAGDTAARSRAMQEVGRTLGLQPSHPVAVETLAELLENPPPELPAEVEERLLENDLTQLREASQIGALAFLSWFAYLALFAIMGIRNTPWAMVTTVLMVAAAFADFRIARSTLYKRPILHFSLGVAAMCSLYGTFGAYLFLPLLIGTLVVTTSTTPRRDDRWFVAILGTVGLVGVAVLEAVGVIPSMTTFTGESIVIRPAMVDFPTVLTPIMIVVSSIALIWTAVILIGRTRDLLTAAERRIQLQLWHLRRLVDDPHVNVERSSDPPATTG